MRRLFVGLSGPIGYDYRRRGAHEANPVLEDVNGLLVCYDELVFLSRGLCPVDLRELEYVRFVTDDSESLQRSMVAVEQFQELVEPEFELGPYNFLHWGQVLDQMTGGRQASIDNHSRPLYDIAGPMALAGNAANVENALLDVCLAGALELPDVDVLTNSVATTVVDLALAELESDREFSDWHVDVAREIAAIRVPNVWSPEGVYNPLIEELRHDERVSDFREYLAQQSPDETAEERAAEISAIAASLGRQEFLASFEQPNLYTTIGKAAIGPLANAVAPPLGTIGSTAMKAFEWVGNRRRADRLRWAAFVVRLQEGASRDASSK